ncbi:general stress protein [Dictyobacter formicarum]|uniref:General stress protein 17M-like domain-containing protein n=1 Tax=Dictyobacter formicarum TaxID=2778368 RepID=A0ABQ3VJF9_9CHLR|nr:general stress protein [Dictyobacter formicarum]GHO86047.1 hypothetical protein KSZ_40530 [Dictyobacter formicarum]
MAVQRRLIVAVFNERDSAESAIKQLYNAGVASDRISYSGEGTGAARGSFIESIKNLFGGTHTHTPTDVMHDLSHMGLAEDEAQYYAQEYASGRTIVAVHPDEQSREVLLILQNSGGYHFHSPEGTGPAAQPRTETNVTNNVPGYAQVRKDEQTTGYDINQTIGERRAAEAGSSYDQGSSIPGGVTPADDKSKVSDTGRTYNQDVNQNINAPDYGGAQGGNIPSHPTENYGQSDTMRRGGTYERNVGQSDYSNQQGYNAPDYSRPQDSAGQTVAEDSSQQQPQDYTAPVRPAKSDRQDATNYTAGQPETSEQRSSAAPGYERPQDIYGQGGNKPGQPGNIEQRKGVPDYSEQVTPPEHPQGPAGPYSQGLGRAVNKPEDARELYDREQRENLNREDI